MKLGKTQI